MIRSPASTAAMPSQIYNNHKRDRRRDQILARRRRCWRVAVGRRNNRRRTIFTLTSRRFLTSRVVIAGLIRPDLTAGFTAEQHEALRIHLGFAIPAAIMLPAMLLTGKRELKTLHKFLGAIFLVLWIGTFVTGVFFLPHTFEPAP